MIFNANEHPESVPAWLLEDARLILDKIPTIIEAEQE